VTPQAAPPPVTLSGAEAEELIRLLRVITARLDSTPCTALADQVARVTAILRLRQWTDGYRQMTGEPR
jgi:hypothetical protein